MWPSKLTSSTQRVFETHSCHIIYQYFISFYFLMCCCFFLEQFSFFPFIFVGFFFLSWRIIASQCCVGFCCTTRISQLCIQAPHPQVIPLHPSPLGHHGVPGWAPCVTQQLPCSYVLHMVVTYELYIISHNYVYSPSPRSSYPIPLLQAITEHQAGLPMLHSSSPVVICFTHGSYICQCYFPSSSYPLLLPLCPQVCSLCLCLYSCPANSFVSTIFLDSIYMH